MTTTPYATHDEIIVALDCMSPTTRTQAIFGLHQAIHDADVATSAGHGINHPASPTYGDDWVREKWPNLWTNLDEDTNVRASYDYNLLNEYHPEAIRADVERKITLLLEGTPKVVALLIQQWADRPGFDPAWAVAPLTDREAGDRHKTIQAALTTWKSWGSR